MTEDVLSAAWYKDKNRDKIYTLDDLHITLHKRGSERHSLV